MFRCESVMDYCGLTIVHVYGLVRAHGNCVCGTVTALGVIIMIFISIGNLPTISSWNGLNIAVTTFVVCTAVSCALQLLWISLLGMRRSREFELRLKENRFALIHQCICCCRHRGEEDEDAEAGDERHYIQRQDEHQNEQVALRIIHVDGHPQNIGVVGQIEVTGGDGNVIPGQYAQSAHSEMMDSIDGHVQITDDQVVESAERDDIVNQHEVMKGTEGKDDGDV